MCSGYPLFQVLDSNTIPMLDTKIVCGATNLPVNSEEDLKLLMNNKILYVTDVVPNRMVNILVPVWPTLSIGPPVENTCLWTNCVFFNQ